MHILHSSSILGEKFIFLDFHTQYIMHICKKIDFFLPSNNRQSFEIENIKKILMVQCKNLTGVIILIFISYLTSENTKNIFF